LKLQNSKTYNMNWVSLNTLEQLKDINTQSLSQPVLIFKHSTRCPISSMAKRNLELDADLLPEQVKAYFLDLIQFRDISNQVSEIWNIKHESPQVLLIYNQECIYNCSHSDIDLADIVSQIEQIKA